MITLGEKEGKTPINPIQKKPPKHKNQKTTQYSDMFMIGRWWSYRSGKRDRTLEGAVCN